MYPSLSISPRRRICIRLAVSALTADTTVLWNRVGTFASYPAGLILNATCTDVPDPLPSCMEPVGVGGGWYTSPAWPPAPADEAAPALTVSDSRRLPAPDVDELSAIESRDGLAMPPPLYGLWIPLSLRPAVVVGNPLSPETLLLPPTGVLLPLVGMPLPSRLLRGPGIPDGVARPEWMPDGVIRPEDGMPEGVVRPDEGMPEGVVRPFDIVALDCFSNPRRSGVPRVGQGDVDRNKAETKRGSAGSVVEGVRPTEILKVAFG